ncbi:hypothetical protein MCEGE10_00332 [Flavobacteriaceae bacterium]
MITLQEFDGALKLIAKYRLQLQDQLENKEIKSDVIRVRTIDMQRNTKISLFNVLRNYYKHELGIELKWDDLKTMDIDILNNIDNHKLLRYRGFGIIALDKFNELMKLYNLQVITENENLRRFK